jgi:hypothetical protein
MFTRRPPTRATAIDAATVSMVVADEKVTVARG